MQLTKPPRRIDVARLVKLGIPNGPHIAKLKNGHEVNLDGRLIKVFRAIFILIKIQLFHFMLFRCQHR